MGNNKQSNRSNRVKAVVLCVFSLLLALFCACEKDSVSTDPDGLGDININPIFLGNTLGEPSVASTPKTNTVVVFHDFGNGLYYHVGTLNPDNPSMSWGPNTEWSGSVMSGGEAACRPYATTSNNGVVMCAFQTCTSSGLNGHIYVGFGTISGSSINWSGLSSISGYNPSIAITGDGQYAVLRDAALAMK